MSEPLSVVAWEGLEPLTPTERRVYEAIEGHWAAHRTGIRIRDLGGTHAHVVALRRKGWVSGAGTHEATGTLVPRVRCFLEARPAPDSSGTP